MPENLHHVPDHVPVIVGSGQCVEHLAAGAQPPFSSPMDLAARAARNALEDAGAPAEAIDAIAVIRLFSDSAGAWASPFGGSNNPPASLARRLGAEPAARLYSDAGGSQPLQVMMEMLLAVSRGERDMVLLAGAEAIASERYAQRNGLQDDWSEDIDLDMDDRQMPQRMVSTAELGGGLRMPVHFYGLIESRQAHLLGHSLQQHRDYMGTMMAPFSAVAARNPYAQFPVAYSAEELASTEGRNYEISQPISRLLVAGDAVNQSAAVLLTRAGKARELGIDPSRWVFVDGYAEGVDRFLSQRLEPGRSTAMSRTFDAALAMADARPDAMSCVDLYSCFPCAVHAAGEALGLPLDGSRELTVTGGLPFFGGPGNNYSLHAVAEMVARLRGGSDRGLVTGNGGMLSKHAAVILAGAPDHTLSIDWRRYQPAVISQEAIEERPLNETAQQGRIVTYTIMTRRDKPDRGVILGEDAAGARFLASTEDPATTAALRLEGVIGRPVTTSAGEHGLAFALDAA